MSRQEAPIRYGRVLKDYFNTKSDRDITIQTEYNHWIKTADYIRFWNTRSDSTILLEAGLGSAELIGEITDQRIKSLRSTVASSSSETSDFQISGSPNSSNPYSSSCSNIPTSSLAVDSVASLVLNEPASLTNLALLDIHNHLTNIKKKLLNEEDMKTIHEYIKISIFVVYSTSTRLLSTILLKNTGAFLLNHTYMNWHL
ncbi:unnamed protein product [Mucor hiemalis]